MSNDQPSTVPPEGELERQKFDLERDKYRLDIAKHFTTLIVGTIVLLLAIRDKVSLAQRSGVMWTIGSVLLLVSLLLCAIPLISAWAYSYDDKSLLPKQSSRDLMVLGVSFYFGALVFIGFTLVLR